MDKQNIAILPLAGQTIFFQSEEEIARTYFSTRKLLDQQCQTKPTLKKLYVFQALLINIF